MATGLYYPFIRFKDEAWLKASALYWDNMARLVPDTYFTAGATARGDSETVQALQDDLGYVINTDPAPAAYEIAPLFSDLLLQHAPALRERYDVTNSGSWRPVPHTALHAEGRDSRLAYVHAEKIDEAVVAGLEAERLAARHLDDSGPWFGMHPHLANVYISALAERSALINGHEPTTDETLDHIAAAGWSMRRLAATLLHEPRLLGDEQNTSKLDEDELAAHLAMISLKALLPKDPAGLTIEQIRAARQRTHAQRDAFARYTRALAEQLPDLSVAADPAAVAAHVQALYNNQVKPELDELERSLRSSKIEMGWGSIAASFTATVPATFSTLGITGAAALGGAAALAIAPVIRSKQAEERKAAADSPVLYLYQLERELQPPTLLSWMRDRIRQFFTA